MSGHPAIGVRVFDCHKLLSAEEVNNEDLDRQLGPQTLPALLPPLELIDRGFHATSSAASWDDLLLCTSSYHWRSFIKFSLYNGYFVVKCTSGS